MYIRPQIWLPAVARSCAKVAPCSTEARFMVFFFSFMKPGWKNLCLLSERLASLGIMEAPLQVTLKPPQYDSAGTYGGFQESLQ